MYSFFSFLNLKKNSLKIPLETQIFYLFSSLLFFWNYMPYIIFNIQIVYVSFFLSVFIAEIIQNKFKVFWPRNNRSGEFLLDNFARYRNQIPISEIIFLRNLPSIIPVPISNNRESTRESSTISQAVVNFRKEESIPPIRAPYCRVPFEYYNFLP